MTDYAARVLIVDDEAILLEGLSSILWANGMAGRV